MKKLHKTHFKFLTFIFLVSHNVGSSQPERVEIFETLVEKKHFKYTGDLYV